MAVREFKDRSGREWRAWEVTPESIHPLTKAEDYLADCYRGGWLVFETVDGLEKRRLCPPPYAWDQRSDKDLRELLERAETLKARNSPRPRFVGLAADIPPNVPVEVAEKMPRDSAGNLDMRYLGVVRRFTYPGGEQWKACVVAPEDANATPVLRFTCATHSIDVTAWPADWVDFTDEQLVLLMREGTPLKDRRRVTPSGRRHDDLRPETG
jgi:hypothetical protein